MTLNHCNLDVVMNELMTSGQIALRQKTIEYFNRVGSYSHLFLLKIHHLAITTKSMMLAWLGNINKNKKRKINILILKAYEGEICPLYLLLMDNRKLFTHLFVRFDCHVGVSHFDFGQTFVLIAPVPGYCLILLFP